MKKREITASIENNGDIFKKSSAGSLKINYGGPPTLGFEELMELYSPKVLLILDEVLSSKETWTVVYQNIWDIMKYGFERKEIRESIIHFKIHTDDEKVHSLQLRHFLSNMILWYAFMNTDTVDIMDESFIFNFNRKNIDRVNDYIDEKIIANIDESSDMLALSINEIVYHITAIAKYASIMAGPGLSVYNIYKTAQEFPEMEEIMFNKPPASLQPNEMEAELTNRSNRLIEIIKQSKCDLAPIFNAGSIMSKGQFQEILVMIGYKSDINGHVIPYPIMSNIFCDGLVTPADFLINSMAARKSLIFQKLMMGIPGAYTKKVTNNTAKVLLRKDYEMCDSTRPLVYQIDNESELLMLNGRYYYDDQDDNKMKCVNGKKDTHLIGRKLNFRSPTTCNSKEGICMYCYGKLFEINNDLASAGAYSATMETEYLGQRVLKTKHVQQTKSEVVEFNEEFDRDFEFSITDIMLKDSGDASDEEPMYLLIDELLKETTDDDTIAYYCYGYTVLDDSKKELYKVVPNEETKLYLSKNLTTALKKSKSKDVALLSFEDINPEEPLFEIEVKSAESMDATNRIKELISKKDLGGCTTIDELCQKMMELKIESGVIYDCVHHEMIIRGLIRKKSNIYDFPDFGPNGDHEDYQMLSVIESMDNTPSPLEALRYPYLKKTLLDPSFLTKTSVSPIDPLFAPCLYDVLPEDHPSLAK